MFLGKSVKMGRGEESTLFQGHAGPCYRSQLSPATPHSIHRDLSTTRNPCPATGSAVARQSLGPQPMQGAKARLEI